jgi:hypothetical protein
MRSISRRKPRQRLRSNRESGRAGAGRRHRSGKASLPKGASSWAFDL